SRTFQGACPFLHVAFPPNSKSPSSQGLYAIHLSSHHLGILHCLSACAPHESNHNCRLLGILAPREQKVCQLRRACNTGSTSTYSYCSRLSHHMCYPVTYSIILMAS